MLNAVKTGNMVSVLLTPEQYDEVVEYFDDKALYELAMYREAHDDGVRYSFEDILARDGMTREEFDALPDVDLFEELGYELDD